MTITTYSVFLPLNQVTVEIPFQSPGTKINDDFSGLRMCYIADSRVLKPRSPLISRESGRSPGTCSWKLSLSSQLIFYLSINSTSKWQIIRPLSYCYFKHYSSNSEVLNWKFFGIFCYCKEHLAITRHFLWRHLEYHICSGINTSLNLKQKVIFVTVHCSGTHCIWKFYCGGSRPFHQKYNI